MTRTAIRTWTSYVAIATANPRHGEIDRGCIERAISVERIPDARGTWQILDQDSADHGVVTGDYLEAGARLFEVTAGTDELAPEWVDEQSAPRRDGRAACVVHRAGAAAPPPAAGAARAAARRRPRSQTRAGTLVPIRMSIGTQPDTSDYMRGNRAGPDRLLPFALRLPGGDSGPSRPAR